ncbi:MAG: hypothetical protein EA382_12945 [Spirochaetaceae bacterium]|nr:MAG: hypothetical protein EA382_12945 [Spirochaetaceae bacterium]
MATSTRLSITVALVLLAVSGAFASDRVPTLARTIEPRTGSVDQIDLHVSYEVDWRSAVLRVRISTPIDAGRVGPAGSSPALIARLQAAIERHSAREISAVLLDLPFDSDETVRRLVDEDNALIRAVDDVARNARVVNRRASPALSHAIVDFELDLYRDIGAALNDRATSARLPTVLGWTPTTEYTGILIYAADRLPWYGTTETRLAVPALFPAFHYLSADDGLLLPLFDASHVSADARRTHGIVHFDSVVDSREVRDRVGARPLLIAATAVFGRSPADIVIDQRDAQAILASAHNRELVREGRVVVVLSSLAD